MAYRIELKDERIAGDLPSYRDALVQIARAPITPVNPVTGTGGMQADELLRSLELVETIKRAGKTLTLETVDYQFLLKKLNAFRWLSAQEPTGRFIRDVRAAEEVDLNAGGVETGTTTTGEPT